MCLLIEKMIICIGIHLSGPSRLETSWDGSSAICEARGGQLPVRAIWTIEAAHQKAKSRQGISEVLVGVSGCQSRISPANNQVTDVVAFRQLEIHEEVVGLRGSHVVPSSERNELCWSSGRPDMMTTHLSISNAKKAKTTQRNILKSIFRTAAFSSRHVHRNEGSNAPMPSQSLLG